MYYRIRAPFYNKVSPNLFKTQRPQLPSPPKYTWNKPMEFKYMIPILAQTNLSTFWALYALNPKYQKAYWHFINLTG
jgi:hypothetical protein